jgi:hypothetical protein
VFITIKRKYINEELEHSFLRVWRYWHAKLNKRFPKRTTKEEVEIEKSIHYLRLYYLFIRMIKQLVCPPIVTVIVMLWNKECNYYKE